MMKLVAAVLVVVYTIEWLSAPPADAVYRATASLGIFPRQAIVLIEFMTIALFLACLEQALSRRFLRRLLALTTALAGTLAAWAMLNDLAPINVVLGFRQYLRPMALFMAGYILASRDPERGRLRAFLFGMTAIAIVQIPVTIYQSIFVTRRAVPGQTPQDVVSGTFGPIDSGTLGMFMVACAGFVLAFGFARNRMRPSAWILVSSLLVPPLLGGVRAVFAVLAGLIVVGFIFLPGDVRLWRRAVAVLGLGALGAAGLVAYDRFIEPGFLQVFGVQYVTRQFAVMDDGGRLTRGAAVLYSGMVISDTPTSTALGKGVGSATRNFVGGPQPAYYHFETDRSLFSRLLIEGGLLGVGILLTILWRVNRAGRQVWRDSELTLVRGTALGVVLATWVGAASLLYGDVLARPQFGYPFWFLAAYMIAVAHTHSHERSRGRSTDEVSVSGVGAAPAPSSRGSSTGGT